MDSWMCFSSFVGLVLQLARALVAALLHGCCAQSGAAAGDYTMTPASCDHARNLPDDAAAGTVSSQPPWRHAPKRCAGAGDDASNVGVMMELASNLVAAGPNSLPASPVMFLFSGAEEPLCQVSDRLSAWLRQLLFGCRDLLTWQHGVARQRVSVCPAWCRIRVHAGECAVRCTPRLLRA